MTENSKSGTAGNENSTIELIRTGEYWLIGINAAAVILNIIIALIYYGQLGEMRKATRASEKAATAAASAALTADATLKEIQKGSTDTHDLATATQDSVKLVGQEVSLQKQVATEVLGANVVITSVTMRRLTKTNRLWAIVNIKNVGTVNPESILVSAQLDFKTPPKGWRSLIRFSPRDAAPLKPSGTSEFGSNQIFYLGQETGRVYIRGAFRYTTFGVEGLPIYFCQYASVNKVLSEGGLNANGDYDYYGGGEDCLSIK